MSAWRRWGAAALLLACGLDTDRDGDGYYAADGLVGLAHYDCDDYDPDTTGGIAYYEDADGDGYGAWDGAACYVCLDTGATPPISTAEVDSEGCDDSVAWVYNSTDCDDADEAQGQGVYYYRDLDGDGYGDPALALATYVCPLGADESAPDGYTDNALDCDDGDAASDASDAATVYYLDGDQDGYGGDIELPLCPGVAAPTDYTTVGEDCDDTRSTVNPGEADCGDDEDTDCDGRLDEDEERTWYYDGDGDGYGDEDQTQAQCPPDSGYVDTAGDCDDSDAANYPGVGDCPDVAEP